jgi:extracellular elastinolytic metalloproteinase
MKKTLLFFFLFTISIGFSQEPIAKIQNYLNNNKAKFALSTQDISDWVVESQGNSDATKIDVYYIKQRYQGIDIFQSASNVWIKNGEVINFSSSFLPNIAQKTNTTTPSVSVLQALSTVRQVLNDEAVSSEIIETTSAKNFKISNGNLTDNPVLAELVYQVTNENTLRLAWDLNFYSQDYNHLWSVRIDAITNQILEKQDWVISCSFGDSNHANHNHKKDFFFNKKGFNEFNNTFLNPQSGSYRVIPYNYDSPNHIARQLIANPHNTNASPFGWHDVNGVAGNEFTDTRGNNVYAQEDADGNNGVGLSPSGGASLLFDFSYGGTGAQPSTYLDAATTNLFYMNNIMHDVWYQYGFNELNGNFQKNNYGKGGTTSFLGDAVAADCQDGSGTNNANFSTPVDGSTPRMQMFLWNVGPTPKFLTINSPASIAGDYTVANNVFSPGNVPLPPLPGFTSNFVLYLDAAGVSEACSAATNAAQLNGKIAIIKRGNCDFVMKVKNAQLAGASAVIIYNNDAALPNTLVNMSGADATITIPAIFMTYNQGNAILAQMALGTVNGTIKTDAVTFVNSDGDFDNGIISHEYGHGISNRLAGGPANSSCLSNYEGMGEGWSDWFALMMQLKSGDVGTTPKGIATFVLSQPTTGPGLRQYPYTTNMSVNPLTFINSNEPIPTDPSNTSYRYVVGEFWATTLWDLSWAYINKYGFDSNIYSGTGGNNKVMQLVLDGLKLQPCNPGIVAGRDALIAADQATTGGQNYCLIWEVFARRGVGVNASSGNNNNPNDQVQDFTQPTPGPNCVLKASLFNNDDMIRVFPNPSNGLLNIAIAKYSGKLNIELYDINGRKVFNQNMNDFNTEKAINLQSIQSGIYLLKLEGDELSFTKKVIIN